LVDSSVDKDVGVFTRWNLNDLIGVETVPLNELVDLSLVVLCVDTESLTDSVSNTRVTKIELDVEDVTVVILRCETATLLDVNNTGLKAKIRTDLVRRAKGLLESKALGCDLPILEQGRRLGLDTVKGSEAVDVDV
jgi:hypothetical protein